MIDDRAERESAAAAEHAAGKAALQARLNRLPAADEQDIASTRPP